MLWNHFSDLDPYNWHPLPLPLNIFKLETVNKVDLLLNTIMQIGFFL